MKDKDKTKKQLMDEIAKLRQRIADLEASEIKHKQLEKALKESEEKYRTLINNINVGLYRNTPGPKGKFVEANSAIIKMFGYKNKDEFLAVNVSDLYQNPAERKKFNDVLIKEGFIKDRELLLKKKDGIKFIGSVSAVAVKDEKGKVLYYDGIVEDITERKKVQEEIEAERKKFETYIESMVDGLLKAAKGTTTLEEIIRVAEEA